MRDKARPLWARKDLRDDESYAFYPWPKDFWQAALPDLDPPPPHPLDTEMPFFTKRLTFIFKNFLEKF